MDNELRCKHVPSIHVSWLTINRETSLLWSSLFSSRAGWYKIRQGHKIIKVCPIWPRKFSVPRKVNTVKVTCNWSAVWKTHSKIHWSLIFSFAKFPVMSDLVSVYVKRWFVHFVSNLFSKYVSKVQDIWCKLTSVFLVLVSWYSWKALLNALYFFSCLTFLSD